MYCNCTSHVPSSVANAGDVGVAEGAGAAVGFASSSTRLRLRPRGSALGASEGAAVGIVVGGSVGCGVARRVVAFGAGGGGGALCAPARDFEPYPIAQERAAKRASNAMGRGRRTCFKEPHMGWNEGRSEGQRGAFGSSSRLSCPRSQLKKKRHRRRRAFGSSDEPRRENRRTRCEVVGNVCLLDTRPRRCWFGVRSLRCSAVFLP